jgi:hypothetical protein
MAEVKEFPKTPPSFADQAAKRYDAIDAELKELADKENDIKNEIRLLEDERHALETYLDTIKHPVANPTPKKEKKTRAPRGPRQSGIRDKVLATISSNPAGIKTGDLMRQMNAEDQKDKTAINNALQALKKSEKIATQDGLWMKA